MSLVWLGEEVAARLKSAAARAIDATTADCAIDATANHPWKNRTGVLETSIEARKAQEDGGTIVGRWGSFTVPYARYLEHGTDRMPPYPYLGPAAKRNYPKLARRIIQEIH